MAGNSSVSLKQKRQTSYGQCNFQVLSGGVPIYSSDLTAFVTNPNFTTQTFSPASSTNATLQYLVACLPGITFFPVFNIGNVTLNYVTTSYVSATLSNSKSSTRSSQITAMNYTSQSPNSIIPTAGRSLTAPVLLGSTTPSMAQGTLSVKVLSLSASNTFASGYNQTLAASTSGGSANTRCKMDLSYLDHFGLVTNSVPVNRIVYVTFLAKSARAAITVLDQCLCNQFPYELPDLLRFISEYRPHCVKRIALYCLTLCSSLLSQQYLRPCTFLQHTLY